MSYLNSIIDAQNRAKLIARAGMFANMPVNPVVATASAPQPPVVAANDVASASVPAPVASRGQPPQPYTRSSGDIKTASAQGKGVRRYTGLLPVGAPKKSGPPAVSLEVAKRIDQARSLDELQNEIAILRRAATMFARGFTKSSQLNVVKPSVDYSAEAEAEGLSEPDVAEQVSNPLPPEEAPALKAYVALGNTKGKDGDPQAKARTAVAKRTKPTAVVPEEIATSVNQVADGSNAVGYTPAPVSAAAVVSEMDLKNERLNDVDGDNSVLAAGNTTVVLGGKNKNTANLFSSRK